MYSNESSEGASRKDWAEIKLSMNDQTPGVWPRAPHSPGGEKKFAGREELRRVRQANYGDGPDLPGPPEEQDVAVRIANLEAA